MPFANLKPNKQAKYMQLLHTEALKNAKAQNPPLFDPQGRILVEVQKLTRKQLKDAGLSKKDIKEVAGQKTVVSVDVSADEDLTKQFYDRVENALERALSEPELLKKLKKEDKKPPRTTAEVIETLKELPKGSVISLQQEYNYHLRLASRVYQQSEPALIGKENELASAFDKALFKTNELIMRHYALAIAQSYSDNSIDLAKLNKELDKARKTIANSAHCILRDEIRQHTGVLLHKDSLLKAKVDDEVLKEQAIIDQSYKNKIAKGIAAIVPERIAPEVKPDREKIRSKLLTKLAEDTVASEDNLLHLDARLGSAVWIEGSKVTAHDRHIKEDGDELATRQIIRHQFKEGTVTAYPTAFS
jgi:uncharacterized protein YjiS (DUF1127 family)